MYYYRLNPNELYHHGVKGMKWGRRKAVVTSGNGRRKTSSNSDYKNSPEYQSKVAKRKKAIKIGAAVIGTVLAAYGTHKLSKYLQKEMSDRDYKKGKEFVEKGKKFAKEASQYSKQMSEAKNKERRERFQDLTEIYEKASNENLSKGRELLDRSKKSYPIKEQAEYAKELYKNRRKRK